MIWPGWAAESAAARVDGVTFLTGAPAMGLGSGRVAVETTLILQPPSGSRSQSSIS